MREKKRKKNDIGRVGRLRPGGKERNEKETHTHTLYFIFTRDK